MPESIKINIPSLEEQKAIVEKMEAVEAEIAAATTEAEKEALRQKKRNIMEIMFGQ